MPLNIVTPKKDQHKKISGNTPAPSDQAHLELAALEALLANKKKITKDKSQYESGQTEEEETPIDPE